MFTDAPDFFIVILLKISSSSSASRQKFCLENRIVFRFSISNFYWWIKYVMRFKNTEISRNPFICYGGYQTTRLLVFVFHVDFSIPACFYQWQWLPYSRCIKFKHINIEMMLAAATFACTFVAVQSFVPGRTFSSTSKPITALAPPIKATHYESIAEIRQVKVINIIL